MASLMETQSTSLNWMRIFIGIYLTACLLCFSPVSTQSLTNAPAKMPYYWQDAPNTNYVCPSDWSQRGRYCYKVFQTSQTFFDAQATCNKYGGYLAKIDLFNTSYWLGDLAAAINATDAWIGLVRRPAPPDPTSHHEWVDRYWPTPLTYSFDGKPTGTLNTISYGNWAAGQPTPTYTTSTGLNALCTRMNINIIGHYPWYMDSCWKQIPFICQYGACANNQQFRCNNFICIDKSLACNGVDDCGDYSDEISCSNLPAQSCSRYLTGSPLPTTGVAISPTPSPYKALTNCFWVIETAVDRQAFITFISVDTEDKYDLVDVYVGGNLISNSRYLLTLSGKVTNPTTNNPPVPTIYSNNNFMIVRFTSDDNTQYTGFSAQWSSGIACNIVKQTGYSLTDSSATVSNGISEAQCTANCLSTVTCQSATFVNPSTCRLHTFIGLASVVTTSNYYVKTCPSLSGSPSLPALPVTSVNYATGQWQTIYPPFFGLIPYLHMARTWTITSYQSFSVLTIDIVNNDLPSADTIDIYDGDDLSPLYSVKNGDMKSYYTTTSSTARVVWNNAQPVINRGFSFRYATGCNIVINADSVRIRTPGYTDGTLITASGTGKQYPNIVTCLWTFNLITTNRNYALFFKNFQVDGSDKVVVTNKQVELTPPPGFYYGLSNQLQISFSSDYKSNDIGFEAIISIDCQTMSSDISPTLLTPPLADPNYYYALNSQVALKCQTGYYFQEEEYGQCPGPGYGLSYDATIVFNPFQTTCLAGGIWSGVNRWPTCQPVYCGPPPYLPYGWLVNVTSYTYGGIAIYQCSTGYKFSDATSNNNLLKCNDNGMWDTGLKCEAQTCPQFGTLKTGLNINQTRTLYPSDMSTRPDPLSNDVPVGTVVFFYCDPNYDLSQYPAIYCKGYGDGIAIASASWSAAIDLTDAQPTCLVKFCTAPTFQNSFVSVGINDVASTQYFIPAGTVVYYTCKGSYTYSDTATSKQYTCQADGSFSPTITDCTVTSDNTQPATCATLTGSTLTSCSTTGSTNGLAGILKKSGNVCYCGCKPGYQGIDCSYAINQCDWPQTTVGAVSTTSYCLNIVPPSSACKFTTVNSVPNCNCTFAIQGYNTAPQTSLTSARCVNYLSNKCSPNPCANGATCINFGTSYYCSCPSGWRGTNCTTRYQDFCRFNPCQNGTSLRCLDPNAKSCNCTSSAYKGVGCQCKTNFCSPNICQNGGTCSMPTSTTFQCVCPAGYTGTKCETFSGCPNSNCLVGAGKNGQCMAGPVGNAICKCPPGWGGDFCNRQGYSWNFDICFGETVGMSGLWPIYRNASSLTLSFWMKTTPGAPSFIAVEITNSSSYTVSIDSSTLNGAVEGVTLSDGNWHLVTIVCDSVATSGNIYLDFARAQSSYNDNSYGLFCSPLLSSLASNLNIKIGRGMNGGCMSLVLMWQAALTFSQVTAIYNKQNGALDASYQQNIIWDWNWGVYYYLNTKGVSRISGSQRGLKVTSAYNNLFSYCPSSAAVQALWPNNITGSGMSTVSWTDPVLSSTTSWITNRQSGQALALGTYPVYYMAKDALGRYSFCEFYQIVNYGSCTVAEVYGTGLSLLPIPSGSNTVLGTYKLFDCSPGSLPDANFPEIYTCWELGVVNVDNAYVPLTTPYCGISEPKTYMVSFGWTYNSLLVGYTPSLASFFQSNINNSVQSPSVTDNLLTVLGCSSCPATVTTGSDVSNYLTIAIKISGLSSTKIAKFDNIDIELALRYEVFVSGLFTKTTYAKQVTGADYIDTNTFWFNSQAECPSKLPTKVVSDFFCVECPAGSKYSSSSCINCPLSTNQSTAGQTTCTNCPSGYTTQTVASVGCIPICAVGNYYDGTACVQCPYGFYQPQAGLTYCLPCPDGKSTTVTGASNITYCANKCGAGTEPDTMIRSLCIPCKVGYYKEANMTSMCVRCPQNMDLVSDPTYIGYSTPGNGSISINNCTIKTCAAGTSLNTTTQMCDPCPVGYYQPLQTSLASVKCLQCPNQTTTLFNMTNNSTQCLLWCPSGYYLNANSTRCLPCAIGFYKDNTYNATTLFDKACTPCDGSVTTVGIASTSASNCSLVVCYPGQYSSGGVCVPCPIDRYQPTTGIQQQCTGVCPAGSYIPVGGNNTDISNCTSFNNSFNLAKVQVTIPWLPQYLDTKSGAYANLTLRATTILNSILTARMKEAFVSPVTLLSVIRNGTVVLYFSVQIDSTKLKSTQTPDVALFQAISAAITDNNGNLQSTTSASSPQPLPVNSTDLQSLMTAIVINGTDYLCTNGDSYNMIDPLVDSCVPCEVGTFQPTGIRLGCMKCAAGFSTLQNTSYGNEWDLCYRVCPPGSEYNGTGSNSVCKPCNRGYYKDTAGPQPCTNCPYFVTTANTGSTSVNQCLGACAAGTYSVWNTTTSQPQCVNCPLNQYKVGTTLLSQNCTQCPPGTYTLQTGSTSPSQCINVCLHPTIPYCQQKGNCSFTNATASCSCPKPFYGSICQFTSEPCSIGEFKNISAGGACQLCPSNTYQDQSGIANCIDCPANSVSSIGSTSLSNCTFPPPGSDGGVYTFGYKIKLLYTWTEQYSNKSSMEYMKLKSSVETIMSKLWISFPSSVVSFKSTSVITFTRGSVVADMILVTDNRITDSKTEQSYSDWLAYQVILGNGYFKDFPSGQSIPADSTFIPPFKQISVDSSSAPDYYCDSGEYYNYKTGHCEPCSVGTYQPMGVLVSCQPCSQNYSTETEGKYGFENITCRLICPPGFQADAPGPAGKCVPCLPGTYKSTTSATICKQCPVGSYAVKTTGLTTINDCRVVCPPGQFSQADETANSVACARCPLGQWKNGTSNANSCTSCAPGYTTLTDGSPSPDACIDACHTKPNVSYCSVNSANCTIVANTPLCSCLPGYTGKQCQSKIATPPPFTLATWIIVLIGIGGGVVVILIFSIIGFCCRRSIDQKKRLAQEKADKELKDLKEKQRQQAEQEAREAEENAANYYPFGMAYPQEAMMFARRPPSLISSTATLINNDNNDNNAVRYYTWKA